MDRSIDLEGCFNFRDLGGYPTADGRAVAWRTLFRSDGLHLLTERDVSVLRDELSLGDVIDLRSTAELEGDGRGRLENEAIGFHHLPLYDGGSQRHADYDPETVTLGQRYFFLAELAVEPMRRALQVIADADDGVVYHCAAGKDRTGVVSAILLGLLGVPDEIIVADYAASKENLDAIIERLMSAQSYKTMLRQLPADTMHAEPETMSEFLALMADKHGSVQAYARSIGVSESQIEGLRRRLLE